MCNTLKPYNCATYFYKISKLKMLVLIFPEIDLFNCGLSVQEKINLGGVTRTSLSKINVKKSCFIPRYQREIWMSYVWVNSALIN